MGRKVGSLAVLALGTAVGLGLWRRLSGRGRDRADLYFADGSMVSFPEGTPDGDRLLDLGRDVLGAARP